MARLVDWFTNDGTKYGTVATRVQLWCWFASPGHKIGNQAILYNVNKDQGNLENEDYMK